MLVNTLHVQSCISHTGYSFTVKSETNVYGDVKKSVDDVVITAGVIGWNSEHVGWISCQPYLHSTGAVHNAARSLYVFSLLTKLLNA